MSSNVQQVQASVVASVAAFYRSAARTAEGELPVALASDADGLGADFAATISICAQRTRSTVVVLGSASLHSGSAPSDADLALAQETQRREWLAGTAAQIVDAVRRATQEHEREPVDAVLRVVGEAAGRAPDDESFSVRVTVQMRVIGGKVQLDLSTEDEISVARFPWAARTLKANAAVVF